MSHDPGPPAPPTPRGFPFPLRALVGLGLTVAGLLLALDPLGSVLYRALGAGSLVLRFLCLAGGLVVLANAVQRHFRTASWDLAGRLESSTLIATGALASAVAYYSMDRAWDSGKLFFGMLVLFCLASSILVLLPTLLRRLALSLLVIFHFAGMVVAVTSVDPPNGTGPWLAKQLWTRVYRPYLSLLYMTNAYHFYSPDPGPPSMVWFAMRYSDGTV
jgi:hypothetical protein